jgi:hypothetical protein
LGDLPADADEGHDDGRNDDGWETVMRSQQMMIVSTGSKRPARHLLRCTLFLVLSVSLLTRSIQADGGSILCMRTSDSIQVTVFSTQIPLRIGQSDISFLVESAADTRPILDAQVLVELENETGKTLQTEATHEQARNKLLYCSSIDFPGAGHWTMKIIVKHGSGRSVLFHHLTVADGQPTLLVHWKLLSFPPLITFLFITNQWLRRRRR